jgi:hypothetical protein
MAEIIRKMKGDLAGKSKETLTQLHYYSKGLEKQIIGEVLTDKLHSR